MGRKLALALALTWLWLPAAALGLGLGDMETRSALNQPFDARIYLTSASDEELRDLEVRLASAEAYERAGIMRMDALLRLRFELVRDADTPYIQVRSREPIREPFLNLLLEVGYSRGRLQREYTVLLDPPTMMQAERREPRAPRTGEAPTPPEPEVAEAPLPAPEPRPEPEAEVTPPPEDRPAREAPARTERPTPPPPEPREEVARPAPSGDVPPAWRHDPEPRAERPAAPRPAAPTPDQHTVQQGESLWRLAERYRQEGVSVHQMMLAIYERNPEAFDDNFNLMREGAVLRIPSRDAAAGHAQADALARARSHDERWRAETAPAPAEAPAEEQVAEQPRLELVAPGEQEDAAEAAAPGAAEDLGEDELRQELEDARLEAQAAREDKRELEDEVGSLREELTEMRRLFEVRSDEMAALEARLAEADIDAPVGELTEEEIAAQPEPEPEPEAEPEAEVDEETEAPATDDDVVDEDMPEDEAVDEAREQDAVDDEAAADAEEDVATEEDESAAMVADDADEQEVAPAPTPSGPATPGMVDEVLEAVSNPAVLGGLLGTTLLLLLLAFQRRRKAAEEAELSLDDELDELDEIDHAADGESAGADEDAALFDEPDDGDEPFEPDRTAVMSRGDVAPRAAADDDDAGIEPAPADDAGDSDAVAEADFHLAYGLYEEAQKIIDTALESDPDSQALKLKRLEILFSAGNDEDFLRYAREFADEQGRDGSDWSKVAIMGRQLVPDESLFAEGGDGGGDLGDDFLDMSVPEDGQTDAAAGGEGDEDFGFDGGDTVALQADADTEGADTEAERKEAGGDDDGDLEFDLADFGLDDDDAAQGASDGEGEPAGATDNEEEDSLAFDLDDDFASLGDGESEGAADKPATDDEGDALAFDAGEFEIDDADGDAEEEPAGDDALTADAGEDDLAFDVGSSEAAADDQPDAESDAADEVGVEGLDLDEEPSAAEADADAGSADDEAEVDFDPGEATTADADDDAGDEDEYDEVATKIDLAKAYIGMDDAEGARSVLEEVLEEGSDQQRKEAQKLLDGMGGGGAGNGSAAPVDVSGDEPLGDGDDVGTKLDLARAYIGMGDEEGAQSIIKEIIEQGDDAQKREAQTLMDQLS